MAKARRKVAIDENQIEIEYEFAIVERAGAVLNETGPWCSLADACKKFSIPTATLMQAAREHRIPALQVQPRRWIIRESAVRLMIGLYGKRGHPVHPPRMFAPCPICSTRLEPHPCPDCEDGWVDFPGTKKPSKRCKICKGRGRVWLCPKCDDPT